MIKAIVHLGGRLIHYWLDVSATSRSPRGRSDEKATALPHSLAGKQKGHCGMYVRTQRSPQRRHTGEGRKRKKLNYINSI